MILYQQISSTISPCRSSGLVTKRVGQSVSGPFRCCWDGAWSSIYATRDAPSPASTPTSAYALASTDLATCSNGGEFIVRRATASKSVQGHAEVGRVSVLSVAIRRNGLLSGVRFQFAASWTEWTDTVYASESYGTVCTQGKILNEWMLWIPSIIIIIIIPIKRFRWAPLNQSSLCFVCFIFA